MTQLENILKYDTLLLTTIKIKSKFMILEKISNNVDYLCTDYYATVPEDQDMTEIENVLFKLGEFIEELYVSFNHLLNSDVKELDDFN